MAEPIAIKTIVTAKIFATSPSPLASFWQASLWMAAAVEVLRRLYSLD
jgi:hypothetical protein